MRANMRLGRRWECEESAFSIMCVVSFLLHNQTIMFVLCSKKKTAGVSPLKKPDTEMVKGCTLYAVTTGYFLLSIVLPALDHCY